MSDEDLESSDQPGMLATVWPCCDRDKLDYETKLWLFKHEPAAKHCPERCNLEQPCVWLCKFLNEKNTVKVLCHEEVHHVLNRIGENPPGGDRFDRRWGSYDEWAKFLDP